MYINYFIRAVCFCLIGVGGWTIVGCSIGKDTTLERSDSKRHAPAADTEPSAHVRRSLGHLNLTVNGESFVQDGLISRDGWAIAFEHVYVTISDVVASQQQETGAKTDETEPLTVAFASSPLTIDLVTPKGESTVIVVERQRGPAGYYNTLDWSMVPAIVSEAETDSNQPGLRLLGQATKDNQTIEFDLSLEPAYRYTCGAFIGDTRKGIVPEDGSGDVEITLHLDHVFGDGTVPADDEVNQESLGFDPFVAIAQDSPLSLDRDALKTYLSAPDYARLANALLGIGHVGEGHCTATDLKE